MEKTYTIGEDELLNIINTAKELTLSKLIREDLIDSNDALEFSERFYFILYKEKWFERFSKILFKENYNKDNIHLKIIEAISKEELNEIKNEKKINDNIIKNDNSLDEFFL